MNNGNTIKHSGVILAIIIFVQIASIICMTGQKEEYFIDEIYSFIISNSYDADRISTDTDMWGKWVNGEDFDKFTTVQEGEEFSYKSVYLNTSTDCHPPLYYWCLHTACSFFQNQYSKWMGVGLNILFFVVSEILIFLIAREIIGLSIVTYVPVIMYGLSSFAVDTCILIRMYMLLTMLALLFIYAHIRLVHAGIKKRYLVAVWISIYLGAMTQYYFIVMSFWGVLLFAIYLLVKRKIKHMLIYGAGSLLSIALMIASFPYAITQATGSSTNNIGNEVAENIFNFKLWLQMTISLFHQMISGISYVYIVYVAVAFVAVVVICAGVFIAIKRKATIKENIDILWMFGMTVLTFVSVSYIGGDYVYLRYIYLIMPCIYIIVFSIIGRYFDEIPKIRNGLILICVIFALSNALLGTVKGVSPYILKEDAIESEKLHSLNNEKLIVVVDEIGAAIPTGNYTKISDFDKVYMDTKEAIENDNVIGKCLSKNGKCVIYIPTDTYWVHGYVPEEVIPDLITLKSKEYQFEKVADGSLGEYYEICSNQ